MIEAKGLVKDFGPFRAVDRISFTVPKGQVLGFLGPNGAGKSTTMKMLTCFLEPNEGTATIGGKDILQDPLEVRRQVGYLPENAPSYGEMTVSEFLEFIAEMRGFRGKERVVAAERIREICFLGKVWYQTIETLSKGYRHRVGFAQALLHDPPVLILDEPTDGLDPNQKHEVRQLIKNMGKDKTIILSTHILEEVETVCQRVIIIAEGKLVADATPEALISQSTFHNAITLRLSPDKFGASHQASQNIEQYRSSLLRLNGIDRVETSAEQPDMLRVFPKSGKPIFDTVNRFAQEQRLSLSELKVEHGRLDDVFRRITTSPEEVVNPVSQTHQDTH